MSGSTPNGRLDREPPRDRRRGSRSLWRTIEWPLVGVVTVAAVVLGYIGFAEYSRSTGQAGSPLDYFYLSLQLFPLQSGAVAPPMPWTLEVARFLAPALTVYVAIKAVLAVFSDQVWRLHARLILRGHVVVCGLGARGMELTEQFLARGFRVVVIESDADNPRIEACRDRGAHVIVGDATDEATLRAAAVQAAGHLVAVLPEDGANAEVAVRARRLKAGYDGRRLVAHVHMADLELCELLRGCDAGSTDGGACELRFFNVLESGARMMLDEVPPVAAEDGRTRNVVVVGLGKMGRSLVSQVAREWPVVRARVCEKLRLTLIDAEADNKVELLRLRHPYLDTACELDVRRMDKNAAEFERAAFLRGPDGRPVDAVFLCFDDDVHVVASALTLDRHAQGIPMVMRMTENAGLAALFDGEGTRILAGDLRPVPLLEWACDPELLLGGAQETLARALFAGSLWSSTSVGSEGGARGVTAAWQELTPARRDEWRGLAARLDDLLSAAGCRTEPCAGLIPAFAFSEREIDDLARQDWPLSDGGGMEARCAAVRAIPAALARAGYAVRRRDEDATPAGGSARDSREVADHGC